ncbi:nuclear cohesin complex subunit [Niveomyces insectorum RCEF 264]|uniref:Nuclear cohesin complex subunit n=1 Tax=Niveomyces insectorum RCEF 264 TaxID=1081102 RepID=A0A167X806_9HYPO|nr:nuclear cohesin complex subunit [Niveomyces insectorum RCEF 264]
MADVADDDAAAATQRRSGRVVRAPNKYQPEAAPAAKRKRPTGLGNGDGGDGESEDEVDHVNNGGPAAGDPEHNVDDDEAEDDDDNDNDNDDDDDDDGDDEEAAAAKRRRRAARSRRKPNATSQQPSARRAAKKPKLNGAANNHASSLPSRPKKSVRVAIEADGDHGGQLYADIFSSGDDSGDVAARWYERYQSNNQAAVADLVNCILSAAGCDHHVTEDDINDPDNCSNRLTELQSIYEDQKITDYPLVAKLRSTRSFRELLVQFFHAFINVLHETEMLYQQPELMENVVRWVASLSSSTLRPFRHTATTVALAMLAALVDVAQKLDERINKMTLQVENQKSRHGKAAKGAAAKDSRLAAFEANLREAGWNRERVAELMKEFFDTVFVHRYRDVDPRIRSECVEALGSWVWALPAVYMQPEYLRYLGWMLSDSNPTTRQEVLKQLARVFKRDASKMGHFIDRFRPRLIEMATKDVDIGVRVGAIAVVEQLRPAGLLDPDEIDAIGRLIFDAELRIRRAAVHFFADCVREFASIKLDEVGGEEVMHELFGKGQSKTGQFDAPRRDWINVKSLANTVSAYELQLGAQRSEPVASGLDVAAEVAHAAVPETSRLALATQVLVDKIPEITNWEILAGYLLYDHSIETKGRSRSKSRTVEQTFRSAVAPSDNEEAILLEILAAAAKASLVAPSGGDGDRFRKRPGRADGGGGGGGGSGGSGGAAASASASAAPTAESSEAAALQLAALIPQLLRKFGAEPATAVTVLRLQHALNLDVFRQLRQDTATFEGLLDEICAQFTRHADTGVVSEAAAALLHARQYDELEEAVDNRVSALWETVINSLCNFDKTCELSARRNLSVPLAIELSVTLFKISKLASIADCVDVLEAEGTSADSSTPAIEILVRTVHRGKFEEPDEDLDNIEDGLTANAIGACQFYFMWKLRSLVLALNSKTDHSLSNAVIDRLAILKQTFDQNVVHTFSSRGYNDDLRLYATGAYCDLHVLFATLRKRPSSASASAATMATYVSLGRLVDHVPAGLVNELISIYSAAERTFAKKTKKVLNDPADDEDPVEDPLEDEDDEDEDEDDEENGGDGAGAGVVDQTGPQAGRLRRRLLRNQTKLGHSYKEIVAFLDENKASELLLANSRKKAGGGGGSGAVRNKGKGPATLAAARTAATDAGEEEDDEEQEGREEAEMDYGVAAPTPAAAAPTPAPFPSHHHHHHHHHSHHPSHLGASTDEVMLGAPTPAADLDDDELDDLLDTPEPEEGTYEDLQRRELLDAGPEEDDDEEMEGDGGGGMDEDDDVLGD